MYIINSSSDQPRPVSPVPQADQSPATSVSLCPLTDEQACIDALFRARWPEGFRCPRCRHTEAYVINTRRLPLFACKVCRKQTSLTAGTVMAGSPTPLLKWFQAIYLHARERGISAVCLAEAIDVTYKTAWLIGHKLRKIMSVENAKHLLDGNLFVTAVIFRFQIYVAGSEWQDQEQSLLVGGVLDAQDNVMQLKLQYRSKQEVKYRNAAPDIQPFQASCVTPATVKAMIRTSDKVWQCCSWPLPRGEARLKMERTDLTRRAKMHAIAASAGAWMAWKFNGIGRKHLQAYLDQFCYAWDRKGTTMAAGFLQQCAGNKAITYPELTGTPSKSARRAAKAQQQSPGIGITGK